jgi:hypothetical protein
VQLLCMIPRNRVSLLWRSLPGDSQRVECAHCDARAPTSGVLVQLAAASAMYACFNLALPCSAAVHITLRSCYAASESFRASAGLLHTLS